jgi:uncharacterized protein (DUF2252 family)
MDEYLESQLKDRDIVATIRAFNRDRLPQLVARKYAKMSDNAFAFLRGSCHLFYQDWPQDSSLNLAPQVWICGDLHLENFGSYKGDDRQIYFGINDFDESELAPCTWDLARLTTSILLAVENLELDRDRGQQLAQMYLTKYANTLTTGNIRAIVADNASGIVGELLEKLSKRDRHEFLDERTELIDDRRQLKLDPEKIFEIDPALDRDLRATIDNWAQTQPNPEFYRILDIKFRAAGTGSLGLDRYAILVEGKGSPDRNYLLDLKYQPHSALEPYLITPQPAWSNQATRVMIAQQLVQSAPPALLAALDFKGKSYLLRELQPTQDKIELQPDRINKSDLEKLINTVAEVTAYAHLHSSGKRGAANAQDLMDLGADTNWQQEILVYANNYAQQVRQDYRNFRENQNI